MANENGSVYGLTLLCPILNDERARPSHDLQIRKYLAQLDTRTGSPFAIAPGTHMARLVVLDDVIYVGMPACEEHLKSKYLVMEANCDGELEAYLRGLARDIPDHLDAIWGHCLGYPGVANIQKFLDYMRACQVKTTFFFAAVNDKSVPQTLAALQAQRAAAEFITRHQGMATAVIQKDFVAFVKALRATPPPPPGSMGLAEKTGGRHE